MSRTTYVFHVSGVSARPADLLVGSLSAPVRKFVGTAAELDAIWAVDTDGKVS